MPFNGNGVFVRLYSWTTDAANPATNYIRADKMDAEMNGFATAFSDCLTRDGQSPPLANLPMGGYRFTGLGPGAVAGDSVTWDQVFSSPVLTSPSAAADPAQGDLSQLLATTNWVGSSFAPLASPTLTGTPRAPTPAVGTNSTQIATAAMVTQAVAQAQLTPVGVVPDFLYQAQGLR